MQYYGHYQRQKSKELWDIDDKLSCKQVPKGEIDGERVVGMNKSCVIVLLIHVSLSFSLSFLHLSYGITLSLFLCTH